MEPPSFAWTEPLAPLPDEREPDRVILVGRRPSLSERVDRLRERADGVGTRINRHMPRPVAALAGVTLLLGSLVGVALISPSGDQASARRAAAAAVRERASQVPRRVVPLTQAGELPAGDRRDPFAARKFTPPPQAATPVGATDVTSQRKRAAAKRRVKAKRDAARAENILVRPKLPDGPKHKADFIFYASDMPWSYLSRDRDSWLAINGEPTLKFVNIDKDGADIFVVSDFEALEGRGRRNATYSYPMRTLRITAGGVIRFVDYRDDQSDAVIFTMRYRRSTPVNRAGDSAGRGDQSERAADR